MDSNLLNPTIIPIRCASTHYSWGTPGHTSFPARLHSLNLRTSISSSKPFSEFVLSSHPPHDALLATNPPSTLRDHIQAQVIEVDPANEQTYSKLHEHGIPYILKVVSATKPNGLRVHPDVAGAAHPVVSENEKFLRPFAKPVILVALTTVDLMIGFHTAPKIVSQLSRVPEFADAVGRSHIDRFVHVVKTAEALAEDVRHILLQLLSQDAGYIGQCLERALRRFEKMPSDVVSDDDRLLITLANAFPQDPMCFSAYFLQRFEMQPGDYVFIQPTETYCVLHGDYIDTSTKSDAVFYAGLTASDEVRTWDFLQTVSCDDSTVEISKGERMNEYAVAYAPPVPDFQLFDFVLPAGKNQQLLQTISPTIILVLEGEGFISVKDDQALLPLHVGAVYQLTPQTPFMVTSRPEVRDNLRFLQIGVNDGAIPKGSASCTIM